MWQGNPQKLGRSIIPKNFTFFRKLKYFEKTRAKNSIFGIYGTVQYPESGQYQAAFDTWSIC